MPKGKGLAIKTITKSLIDMDTEYSQNKKRINFKVYIKKNYFYSLSLGFNFIKLIDKLKVEKKKMLFNLYF